eukprot:6251904-Prymnesium_polylepis.1
MPSAQCSLSAVAASALRLALRRMSAGTAAGVDGGGGEGASRGSRVVGRATCVRRCRRWHCCRLQARAKTVALFADCCSQTAIVQPCGARSSCCWAPSLDEGSLARGGV